MDEQPAVSREGHSTLGRHCAGCRKAFPGRRSYGRAPEPRYGRDKLKGVRRPERMHAKQPLGPHSDAAPRQHLCPRRAELLKASRGAPVTGLGENLSIRDRKSAAPKPLRIGRLARSHESPARVSGDTEFSIWIETGRSAHYTEEVYFYRTGRGNRQTSIDSPFVKRKIESLNCYKSQFQMATSAWQARLEKVAV